MTREEIIGVALATVAVACIIFKALQAIEKRQEVRITSRHQETVSDIERLFISPNRRHRGF